MWCNVTTDVAQCPKPAIRSLIKSLTMMEAILNEYWLTSASDFRSNSSGLATSEDLDLDSSSIDSDLLIDLGVIFFNLIINSTLQYGILTYDKMAYHTSALTGEMWVLELLNGHPECIRNELSVHKHVFRNIIKDLHLFGHQDSKAITLEEQLAIFLYTCITGLSIRHVSEHFQHATETTSWYINLLIIEFIY